MTLELPTGMAAKIASAQQTLYNNAEPEMQISAYVIPTKSPTAWSQVARIQHKSGIAVYTNEYYTFVYFWDTVNAVHYWNSHVSFYDRATKEWTDFEGQVPPDNYTDNYWRWPLEIYGTTPDDFWLCHSRGVSHWVDGGWIHKTWPGESVAPTSICGRGDEVWVSVRNLGIAYWDGVVWDTVVEDGHATDPIIAFGNDNVYSVASYYTNTLHHFDGVDWEILAAPNGYLRAVLDDGYALFSCGSVFGGDLRIELYNPTTDTYSTLFTGGGLWGGIYAVDRDDFYYSLDSMIFHFGDNDTFGQLNLSPTGGTWKSIVGSNRDNIWAVRNRGNGYYDLWRKGPADDDPDVYDIHYEPYWDMQLDEPLGVGKTWMDITALDKNHIWICNDQGEIYFFNGLVWAQQHDLGVENGWHLESIIAFDSRNVWCVGWTEAGETGQYIILHYDVHGWNNALLEDGPPLTWIWGSSLTDIWAVGNYGLQIRWNGNDPSAFSVEGYIFRAQDAGVWNEHEQVRMSGCAADEIWSVGRGGRVNRWNGSAWSTDEYYADSGIDLNNVSCVSQGLVRVSGNTEDNAVRILYTKVETPFQWHIVSIDTSKVSGPTRGIWAWRQNTAYICSSGGVVMDASKPDGSIAYDDIEGRGPAINQFWKMSGDIWAVGHSAERSGVWKYHPADVVKKDISRYLVNGDLTLNYGDPISALTLELENPDSELLGEILPTLLTTGMTFELAFRAGDTAWFPLGLYYMDRGNYAVLGSTVSIDARNAVGKFLKTIMTSAQEATI